MRNFLKPKLFALRISRYNSLIYIVAGTELGYIIGNGIGMIITNKLMINYSST